MIQHSMTASSCLKRTSLCLGLGHQYSWPVLNIHPYHSQLVTQWQQTASRFDGGAVLDNIKWTASSARFHTAGVNGYSGLLVADAPPDAVADDPVPQSLWCA